MSQLKISDILQTQKEYFMMALGQPQPAVELENSAPTVAQSDVTAQPELAKVVEQPNTNTNTNTDTVSPARAEALQKRNEFWKNKLACATDDAMVEAATEALGRIAQEAKNFGVNLTSTAVASEGGGGKTVAKLAQPKKSKQPRSVTEKEAAAAHKAGKLAEQAASKPAGAAKMAAPKVAKEKILRDCLDGCGAQVPGNFQMGHDAKLKSILLKIEKGELALDAVPLIAQGIVKFKKAELEELQNAKGEKTGVKVQHYTLLAAPVKFHGRPEIQFTQRETT